MTYKLHWFQVEVNSISLSNILTHFSHVSPLTSVSFLGWIEHPTNLTSPTWTPGISPGWVPQTSATWPRYAPAWHSLVKRHYCTTDVGQGFNPGNYGEKWWCYIYVGWLVVEATPHFEFQKTWGYLSNSWIVVFFAHFLGGFKKQNKPQARRGWQKGKS